MQPWGRLYPETAYEIQTESHFFLVLRDGLAIGFSYFDISPGAHAVRHFDISPGAHAVRPYKPRIWSSGIRTGFIIGRRQVKFVIKMMGHGYVYSNFNFRLK